MIDLGILSDTLINNEAGQHRVRILERLNEAIRLRGT